METKTLEQLKAEMEAADDALHQARVLRAPLTDLNVLRKLFWASCAAYHAALQPSNKPRK